MKKRFNVPADFIPPTPKGGWSWRTLSKDFLQIRRQTGKGLPKQGLSFGDRHPEISKEFFEPWNGGTTPRDFRPRSGIVVFWKCPEAHIYPGKIAARSAGAGCPICLGQRPSRERNLSTLYPEIATQWHTTLNGTWTPEDFLPQSDAKAVWLCPYNPDHLWVAAIKHRTYSGSGCPLCRGKSSKAEMRLLAEFRGLLGEANVQHRVRVHGREVDMVLQPPGAPAICVEFDGTFYHRGKQVNDDAKLRVLERYGEVVLRVRGAGLERKRKLDVSVSYDAEVNATPELGFKLAERVADLIPPSSPAFERVRIYLAEKRAVNQAGYEALMRTMNRPKPGTSLLDKQPDIIRIWSSKNSRHPRDIAFASNDYFYLKCNICGHEWSATGNNISKGKGCFKCAKKTQGERLRRCAADASILARYPDLVESQWDYERNRNLFPSETAIASNQVAWWRCKACGRSFRQQVQTRVNAYSVRKDSGCIRCLGVGVIYVFRNSRNGERVEDTLSGMVRRYRLSAGDLSAVCKGTRPHAGGWVCLGIKGKESKEARTPPMRLYGERFRFRNLDSGEEFVGTQKEFRDRYELAQTTVSRICRSLNTALAWVCLGKQNEVDRDLSRFQQFTRGCRYEFRNIQTGQSVVATLAEMSSQFGIFSSNLSKLKAGKIRSYKGWQYVGRVGTGP